MVQPEKEITAKRLDSARRELVACIEKLLPADGIAEPVPGVLAVRLSKKTEKMHSVFTPAFCIIAKGAKQVMLGDEIFRYDHGNYLIATVDVPIVSYVVEATTDEPYLSLKIDLDPAIVASVLMEAGVSCKKGEECVKAMNVSALEAELLDAVVRLMRAAESAEETKLLVPLIMREIVYRLMRGEQGARLKHLLAQEGDTRRISRAVEHLRTNIAEPLKIENLARDLGMSVSGFHHHFKSVTAMSPLQYQKHLRLQEARRLMLGEDMDAASAGFKVGYEDPAYFSRDYKKLFGNPPQRDISRLKNLERV